MAAQSDFRPDLMKGKVVVITGGGTGIGFGISTVFGQHGAKVFIGGRRENVLQEACQKMAAQGIVAGSFTCDVRDPESCDKFIAKAVERFGGVDVLINNAAGNFSVPLEKLSSNGMKTVMEIDLHGTFNMCKAALPSLKVSGKGVIINISATLYYKAFPFQAHASAAKAAIDVLTNNIGTEWGADYGIRCVSIAPGPIEGTVGGPGGRVFGKMLEMSGMDDPRMLIPIGRYGTVNDIANTAMFVCSNAGSYVNATTIVVDGGHWHDASGKYLLAKQVIESVSKEERRTHKGGVSKL